MARIALDPDALAALEDQREFLRRSIADLDAEHRAGDLDDADLAGLRDDYARRLAAVEEAIETGVAERREAIAATRRSPAQRLLVGAAVLAFAVACGFGVAAVAGRRTAGDSATGETRLGPRELLAKCLSTSAGGDLQATVACYESVLKIDPTNVEARTYRAGIQVMAGDASRITDLIDIVEQNPTYPDAHAFLAVALYRLGRPDSALAELKKLDALKTSPFILDITSNLRSQLEAASTTTPTTAPAAGTPPTTVAN